MSEIVEPNTELFSPEVQAKLDALRARLDEKATVIEEVKAPSVSEAPRAAGPITGADVDWNEYALDFNLRHLYPKAILRETQDGPKWIYVATEFHSVDLYIGNYGGRNKDGDLLNLGEYLTKKLLSHEGWKISGIIPASLGKVALLIERPNPLILPDPRQLEKTTVAPEVTDGDVDNFDESTEQWVKGLTGEATPATIEPLPPDAIDLTGAVEGE